MILNRERLAEFIGCSLRTVDEYRRQGMPGDPPKRGGDQWRFDSSACVEWLRSRERSNALGEIAQIDEGEARRRKLAAEAAMAEHELAEKQGAAVAISDFQAAWAAMIGAARAKLLGISSKTGPEVALLTDPAECEAVVDSAIREALQELSELEPDIQVEPAGDSEPASSGQTTTEAVGAAAGPDRKRVGGRGTQAKPRKQR